MHEEIQVVEQEAIKGAEGGGLDDEIWSGVIRCT
jgi:hypothetical protein